MEGKNLQDPNTLKGLCKELSVSIKCLSCVGGGGGGEGHCYIGEVMGGHLLGDIITQKMI